MIQATATIASLPGFPSEPSTIPPQPAEKIPPFRPSPSVFARAIVPESERSPSLQDPPMTIEEIEAEIAELEKLDRELDDLIARAGRPEPRVEPEDPIEAIFAPWDPDVDDEKRD